MADVTGLDVSPGDEVVHHRTRRATIASTCARWRRTIGTIPWEIVCRIGTRIERVYD